MFCRSILAISLALAGSSAAYAATDAKEPFPLSAESTEEFREQATALRGEMDKGEYDKLSNVDKRTINERLDQLDALYVKRGAGAKLDNNEAVTLINASSEINAVLRGNNSEKLVCERVKLVGSNRSNKVCMSVADREERRRGDLIRLQDQNLTGRKFREQ